MKKVLTYSHSPMEFIVVGQRATIHLVEPPWGVFTTTYVTKYDVGTGEFETESSIFKPKETKDA
jgi:hypothetical protein